MRQSAGEIGRDGGFSDAALSARDGDDVLGALEADAAGFLAKLGLDAAHAQLNFGDAKIVRERMMHSLGDALHHLIARGHLAKSKREAVAIGKRRDLLDQAERGDIGRITGIGHSA